MSNEQQSDNQGPEGSGPDGLPIQGVPEPEAAPVDEKFANVPAEELRKYVEESAQKPGEADTHWAERVRLAELTLLAKHNVDVSHPEEVIPGEPAGTSSEA